MNRRRLLAILQRRCAPLGVTICYRARAPPAAQLAAAYDLVVAADGASSAIRTGMAGSRSGSQAGQVLR